MAHFKDDLYTLRGRVVLARPDAPVEFVNQALNDRLRQILDHRTFWADLLTFGMLSFPAAYTTGTVSVATGDATVTGAGTNWPVADVVNGILPDGVSSFGYVEVVPDTMNGITAESMLYVDAAGPEPEIVPVVEVNRNSFIGKFEKVHDSGCSITQSSLANLQFRVSESHPVFTVGAVTAPGSLELTLPWGGVPLTAQAYRILKMYVTLASDLKAIIAMKDESTGFPVRLHVSQTDADHVDPQRSVVTGQPYFSLVDLGASPQGNMLYETWPAPQDRRQFSYAYWKQWPDMRKDTDRPPPFINSSILTYGAIADAKMLRTKRDDPFYDPEGARFYIAKFEQALQEAKNADEAKRLEAMRNPWWKGMYPGNYDTLQLNDPAMLSFFGGSGY